MKSGIRKVLQITVLSLLLVQATPFHSAAGEAETVQQTKETVVASPGDADSDFEKELEQNGKRYSLSDVETMVSEVPQLQEVEKTVVITSPPFKKGAEYTKPAPTYFNPEDGITYELKQYEIVDVMVEERTKSLEKEIVYEDVEQLEGIPQVCRVQIHDPVLMEDVETTIPLKEYAYDNYQWKSDFEFPVKFHEYDADYYALGDALIPKNEMKPAIEGYEEELLNLIGADSRFYTIEDISWSSDPYMEDGAECRLARATGKKLVATCKAYYQGIVRLKETEASAVEATYMTTSYEETGKTEYDVTSVATYVPHKNWFETLLDLLWRFITSPEGMISIALIFLILLMVVILEILKKKRGKDPEKENGSKRK